MRTDSNGIILTHMETGSTFNDLLNLSNCSLMIERSVLTQPLKSVVLLVGIDQRLINELQIFSLSLSADKFMSFFKNWLVVDDKAQPVPSLFNFWVDRISKIIISIYLSHRIWL